MFIKKLDFTADLSQIKADLDTILTKYSAWGVENQIGLTYRNPPQSNPWKDSVGSLYDRDNNIELVKESEFTELNSLVPDYTKQVLTQFSLHLGFKLGRVRFMRLMPKTGLTVHCDNSVRYHFVLETNQFAYFGQTIRTNGLEAVCYHIPADSHFYRADTTKEHFVYNGGNTPRIHLVICPI